MQRVTSRNNDKCHLFGDQAGTADHDIPRTYDGRNDLENLGASCFIGNTVAGGTCVMTLVAKKTGVVKERRRQTH